ncbi:MAG: TonB-dependent receptor domain-containing protein [Pseudomonadota bacterium]
MRPTSLVRAMALGGLVATAIPATAAESTEKIEEITVTGSYIKRDNFDSPSPVVVIDQMEIEASATVNMADIIFNQPQNLGTEVMANPSGTGTSASSQRTGGSAQGGIGLANLRGLGERATMDLMDGHRVLFGDANFIYPQIATQRIEILLDGASALYGSEAIAGAVNYIPVKNYDGVKIELSRRDLVDTSSPDDSVAFMIGQTFDKGSALFALSFRERARIKQSDFPEYLQKTSDAGINLGGISFPGSMWVTRRNATGDIHPAARANNGFTFTNAFEQIDPGCGNSFMDTGSDVTLPGQLRWGADNPSTALQRCQTDYSYVLDYQSELSQIHGYARMDYQFSDNIALAFDMMVGRQEFDTRAVPSPIVSNDPFNVSGDLPGNPFTAFIDTNANGVIDANEKLRAQDNCNFVDCSGGDGIPDRDINGDGIADPAAQGQWGVPHLLLATTDTDGDGIPDRRDDDAGGVSFSEDVVLARWTPFGKNIQGFPSGLNADGTIGRNRNTDNLRLSGTLDIQIPDTTWSVDITGVWGRRSSIYPLAFGSVANFSTPQLQDAFNCVNPADIAAERCMSWNPFSTSQFLVVDRVATSTPTPPTSLAYNSQAQANAIFLPNDDEVIDELTMLDIVTTGEIIDLWAGPLQVAAGIHYRQEYLDVRVNALNSSSTNTFGTAIQPLRGTMDTLDYFAEFNLPLVNNSLLGVAELQLAARRTTNDAEATKGLIASSSFDDTVTKYAILWQPTDWLSLRASVGEGFVVPEFGDLFTAPRDAARAVRDPTCGAISTELGVQISDTFCDYNTTGAVLTQTGVVETISGDPSLKPESSTATNVGFTLSLLDGDLSLQADWLEVDYEDVIFQFRAVTLASFDEIRFAEFLQGSTCADVTCAEALRLDWINNQEDPKLVREGGTGRLAGASASFTNLLYQKIEGGDVQVRYRLDAQDIPFIGGEYGEFVMTLKGSYMDLYEFQTGPVDPIINGAGQRNDSGAGSQIPPVPRWRATTTLSWSMGKHFARISGRYHSRVSDLTPTGAIRAANTLGYIPTSTYWDLFYSYRFDGLLGDGRTVVSVGVQNAFDKRPHPIEDSGGVDTNLDTPLGTSWTLRLSHEF